MSEGIQFKVKLPGEVKQWIEAQAAQNLRSQSNEIILAVREKMARMSTTTTQG